jgi:CHAT domain-containing protein
MVSVRTGRENRTRIDRGDRTPGTSRIAANALTLVLLLTMMSMATDLRAQTTNTPSVPNTTTDRTVPTQAYFNAFGLFYDGDYETALKAFESDSRNSIKSAQSRWIDSICYETMCGECLFHMGMLKEALPHYTAALTIYKSFSDWMVHLTQMSPTIPLAGNNVRKIVPWGMSKRQSQLGVYRQRELLFQGQVDFTNVIQQGGVVQAANAFPVVAQEIVRCTTLALRRRALLLGPACKHDPLTNDLIVAMGRAIGPPNHWTMAWTNLESALAFQAGGKAAQAASLLQQSVVAGGGFDHPMTSIALLELGQQALKRGDYPTASQFFEEATYSAVNYPDYDVLEEAFRGGMLAHLLANRKGIYPLLEHALQWAKSKNLRQLRASLLLLAAENYAILGETRSAEAMLEDARATIGRRAMGLGSLGGRLSYLSALVSYQQKRIPEGDKFLATAMNYMQHGSLWLFHIGWADRLYLDGVATPRMALDLFSEVLRDPQPTDWNNDPMEALAVMTTPHPAEIEHWFEAALSRTGGNEVQTAIEVSERARRHRFFNSLELGGRLESLRWVLEAAPASLPQQAMLQRQDILARYPAYQKLSRQAQTIHAALAKMPLVADDPTAQHEQSRQLTELAALGVQQEAILREIALRREPAALVFPPLRTVPEIQKTLPPKHAVLAFFATEKQLYGFLLNNERFGYWRVGPPASVLKPMQTMLRDMGMFQPNHEFAVKELADAKWKQSAQQVLDMLLKGSPADFSQSFEELVIVPDGALWYLPFEALQVRADRQMQSLISRFGMRYVPMLSLVSSQGAGRNPLGNTAVVLGKLYPRDDEKVARSAFDQLAAVVPDAVAIHSPPPAPSSVYSTLFQRLIVLDDMPAIDQDPYGWSPAPIDRGKTGGSLRDWLALPWGGPDIVVLPGFHTAAEDAMKREDAPKREDAAKRAHRSLPGNEVFLSVCGLMANGARTVLLSRWRTGGQTSFDLVREFVQELPRLSAANAWQRAVSLVCDSRLNLDAEPRIKHPNGDESPKGDHPFFWAGYMLVDCGGAPEKAEPKPEKPAIDIKKPEKPAGDIEKPDKPGGDIEKPVEKDQPPENSEAPSIPPVVKEKGSDQPVEADQGGR